MKGMLLALLMLFVGIAPAHAAEEEDLRTPGVSLSETITEVTGIAISPLLGVSAVGSWKYYNTPPEERDQLGWYCQPWAWGSGFAILLLCFIKDTLGTAAPGVLKKPLDMAELLENKASAIVAGVGVIPLIVSEFTKATGSVEVPAGMLGIDFIASIDSSWFTIPLAVIAFGIIWVCSHAVNVLIILSPFSTLDALLKLSRTAVLALVAITYAIAPWLGAAFCIMLFIIALFFAPAAVRLMHFGTHVAMDVLFPGRASKKVNHHEPKGFTICKLTGLPRRICGRLVARVDGSMELHYRRMFFLPEKSVLIPSAKHMVAKGLITPSIIAMEDGKARRVMILLPRYRGHEETISEAFGLDGVHDYAWKRGWRAIKNAWAQWRGKAIAVSD